MADTSTPFTNERAPCGKRVSGHRHREDDESGMVFDDVNYDCGCRTTSGTSSMTAAFVPGSFGMTVGCC